jgi:hypothetical protein
VKIISITTTQRSPEADIRNIVTTFVSVMYLCIYYNIVVHYVVKPLPFPVNYCVCDVLRSSLILYYHLFFILLIIGCDKLKDEEMGHA